jgi:hypothetical protein
MSGHKSAVGEIPDEWFENDTDPDAGKGMEPSGFIEGLLAELDELDEDEPSLREPPPQTPRSGRQAVHAVDGSGG